MKLLFISSVLAIVTSASAADGDRRRINGITVTFAAIEAMNLVQKGQVVSSSPEQKLLIKKDGSKSNNKSSGKSSNKSTDNSKSRNNKSSSKSSSNKSSNMIHPHSLRSQSHLASHLVNQGMASLPARVPTRVPRVLVVLAVTVNVKSIAVKRHVKPISVPAVSVVI